MKLKPCPFCGSKMVDCSFVIGPYCDGHIAQCLHCSARIHKYYKTYQNAKRAWNRRADEKEKVR